MMDEFRSCLFEANIIRVIRKCLVHDEVTHQKMARLIPSVR
jgi:hypothetical protein